MPAPADVAEATGLTRAYGDALVGLRQRCGGHDPGRVAVDVAVMLADGGEAICDLAVPRDQVDLFGPVASDPTAWRVFHDGQCRPRPGAAGSCGGAGSGVGAVGRHPGSCPRRPRPGSGCRGWCWTWTPRSWCVTRRRRSPRPRPGPYPRGPLESMRRPSRPALRGRAAARIRPCCGDRVRARFPSSAVCTP
jgi:hypothetical protein